MGKQMDHYYHRYGMEPLRNEYPVVVFDKSNTYKPTSYIRKGVTAWCYYIFIKVFAYKRQIAATLMKKQHAQIGRWTVSKHQFLGTKHYQDFTICNQYICP
jgi:hypothetical protein